MADIEKVKQGLRCCDTGICNGCPFKNEKDETYPLFCQHVLNHDALSVIEEQQAEIERMKTNEGAIENLCVSGWMQNHDKEMMEDGTFFVMWLSELMMHTDDEPIKPSEIIDRIKEGGFRRFVDDWCGNCVVIKPQPPMNAE